MMSPCSAPGTMPGIREAHWAGTGAARAAQRWSSEQRKNINSGNAVKGSWEVSVLEGSSDFRG